MTDHTDSPARVDYLDELVSELLECGAVLSQIVSHMVRCEASGRGAPDAAPIPEVAHSMVRGALGDIRKRHSKRDIIIATRVVAEAVNAISDEIFLVDPEWIDETLDGEES